MILQYCKIDSSMVSHVLEVNQDKFNKFTPGTNIPIISKAKLAKLEFDYFLVLPWHFKKFIVQKEKKINQN